MFPRPAATRLSLLARRIRAALRTRAGSVAIMTALAAPALIMVAGFTLDYGYASYLNQRLARAADAAVLTAVSQSAATAVGGYSNTSGLQTYGNNVFTENTRQLALTGVSFNLAVTPVGLGVSATGTYSYNSPALFGGLVGRKIIPVSGSVTSTAQPPTYVNYYILVDVSNSMGIGATQADMNLIWNQTVADNAASGFYFSQDGSTGCVFACHDPAYNSNIRKTEPRSSEAAARAAGASLRLDAAVSAIQSIITSASSVAGTTKNISFGLYLLQNNPNTGKNLVMLDDPPTSNYSKLLTDAGTIDLGSNSGTSTVGDTDLNASVTNFNSSLPANGSGASAVSPLNYVFLITDGVNDHAAGTCGISPSCVSAMSASSCAPLKTKATVGVIYTTYLPIWANNNPGGGTYESLFNTLQIQKIIPQLPTALGNCATSSDLYFEADDGPSITTYMQALFAKTLPVTARLTN